MSLTKVNYIDNSTIITAKNLNDIQDNIIDIQDDIINIQDKLQTTNNKTKAGFIYPLANNTVPDGFLLCDGAEYSRNDYPELFAAIGTMYGAGDGTTTFNVPNLSTRVPIGSGDGYELGDVGGEAAHTLTVNEMPSHSHSVHLTTQAGNNGDYFKVSGSGNVDDAATTWRGGYTNTIGGSQPHNNMQPYTVINYIIATGKDTGVSVADIIAGVQTLPLGIEYGGTGATNARTARELLEITPENIGAISMELLWENASPDSEFAAQTINLDLNAYDRLKMDFYHQYDPGTLEMSIGTTVSAHRCYIYDDGGVNMAKRTITTTESGIKFNDGVGLYRNFNGVASLSKPDNTALAPTRIYGIRGVSA